LLLLVKRIHLKRMGSSTSKPEKKKSKEDENEIRLHGVSLKHLNTLIVTDEATENFTVYDVCERIIKPITKAKQCSYAELLLDDKKKKTMVIQKADIFISCKFRFTIFLITSDELTRRIATDAWAFKWTDLLECLNLLKSDVHVWLDIVSVNQHESTKVDYEGWLKTFGDAIQKIGVAGLVIMPWVSSLTRCVILHG
jgi:hypothetical protein